MINGLKGKNAIITGASKGIGKATALAFAKAGVNILINYVGDETEAAQVREQARGFGVKASPFMPMSVILLRLGECTNFLITISKSLIFSLTMPALLNLPL